MYFKVLYVLLCIFKILIYWCKNTVQLILKILYIYMVTRISCLAFILDHLPLFPYLLRK